MACRFDASADALSRTTSLPSITAFTMMAWVYLSVDRNAFTAFFAAGASSGGSYCNLGTGSDGTTLLNYNSSASTNGTNLSTGTWYHLAWTSDSTNLLAYLNGTLDITRAHVASPPTNAKIWLGNDNDSEFLNGLMAAVKIYGATLTAAEIQQEMRQYLPVRTANLNTFLPLHDASTSNFTVDYSGSGNTMTAGGTLASEAGPPIPWRVGRRGPKAATRLVAAINFRATSGYVADGAGETYSLGEAYPTTRGGATFGWNADLTGNARDRDSAIDRRLAGIVFTNSAGKYFQIDLPSAGTYRVYVAAGDTGGGNGALWDLQDTTTVLASLTGDLMTAYHWKDASDADLTNSTWPGSNVPLTLTFATSAFRLKMRGAAINNNVIAHLRIESGAAASAASPPGRAAFFAPQDPLFLFDE